MIIIAAAAAAAAAAQIMLQQGHACARPCRTHIEWFYARSSLSRQSCLRGSTMLHLVWSACSHQHARCDARNCRGDSHGNTGFRGPARITSQPKEKWISVRRAIHRIPGSCCRVLAYYLLGSRFSPFLIHMSCSYLDVNRFLFGRALVQVPALAEFRVVKSRPRRRPP